MKQKLYVFYAAFLLLSSAVTAQTDYKISYQQYNGEQGIKKKLSELISASNLSKLSLRQKVELREKPEFDLKEFRQFKERTESGKAKSSAVQEEMDTLDEPTTSSAFNAFSLASLSPFNIWSNYLASTFDEAFSWPPDPNGAVGTSQVVVLMNAGIKVYEKRAVTDAPLVTSKGISNTPAPAQLFITLDNFFRPVLRDIAYTSDPRVRFDRLTKRWFVVAIDVDPSFKTNNFILLAVSDGERITNTTNFTYYRIPTTQFPSNTNLPLKPLLDYPTLGVDKNAALIGGSLFFLNSNGFGDSIYTVGYAVNKQALIRGQLSFAAIKFGFATDVSAAGMYVPQGVYNDDPLATKSFFAGINFPQTSLLLAGLNYNANNQLTGINGYTVPVEPFQFPRDITAPGSPMPIDPLDTRLFAAAIHKNKVTGKSSLWTANVIGVNRQGRYVPDSVFVEEARTATRWYEVDNIYTGPRLNQLGTLYDPTRISGRRAINFFNSTIATNGQGFSALGGTVAAFNRYLNVYITGRSNNDTAGTLGIPERATLSKAIYAPIYGFYIGRWGDYSQSVVDPMDDQTIWTFQEYANADDSYGVRAVQLKAPPPAIPIPFAPLSNRADNTVTLNGISINNAGFFDPGADLGGPGYNRLSVKSTGNIIVSNVRFISPTRISFSLNTKNKPAGRYTLVITNPDGQFVVADYRIVRDATSTSATVNAANNYTPEALEKVQKAFIQTSVAHPNPTQSNVTIQVNAAKSHKAKFIVLDLGGKQIFDKSYNLNKGTNEVEISLAGYSKGTYIITIFNSDNLLIAQHRIVKS